MEQLLRQNTLGITVMDKGVYFDEAGDLVNALGQKIHANGERILTIQEAARELYCLMQLAHPGRLNIGEVEFCDWINALQNFVSGEPNADSEKEEKRKNYWTGKVIRGNPFRRKNIAIQHVLDIVAGEISRINSSIFEDLGFLITLARICLEEVNVKQVLKQTNIVS